MKLNIILHSVSSLGGVNRASTDLANALVSKGVEVNIISLGGDSQPKYELHPTIEIIDLEMAKPYTTSYSGGLKTLWFAETATALSKLFNKSLKIDEEIWLFTSPPLCILASLLKFKYSSSMFIGHEHMTTAHINKGKVVNTIKYKLYQNLDMMISLTKPDNEVYKSLGIKARYIPNFILVNKEPVIVNHRNYVLFVGRFSEVKRPLTALDIYNKSKLYERGIKLRMFGSGDLEQDIREFIKDNQLDEFVEIYNNIEDVNEIYKDGYILMMTSEIEGLPMVLLEAMSRDIPCISYDIPYGPQSIIINGENGFLIEPGDSYNYINKLKDPNISNLFNKDISNTISKFSKEKVIPMWLNLMHDLSN